MFWKRKNRDLEPEYWSIQRARDVQLVRSQGADTLIYLRGHEEPLRMVGVDAREVGKMMADMRAMEELQETETLKGVLLEVLSVWQGETPREMVN